MHHINQNIKWYRDYKRLTQQELAESLQTTLGRVKTYESGKATPPVEMLIAIASMMNVTLDALVNISLDDMNYRAVKRDRIKEYKFFDDLVKINTRLDKLEQAVKSKRKR